MRNHRRWNCYFSVREKLPRSWKACGFNIKPCVWSWCGLCRVNGLITPTFLKFKVGMTLQFMNISQYNCDYQRAWDININLIEQFYSGLCLFLTILIFPLELSLSLTTKLALASETILNISQWEAWKMTAWSLAFSFCSWELCDFDMLPIHFLRHSHQPAQNKLASPARRVIRTNPVLPAQRYPKLAAATWVNLEETRGRITQPSPVQTADPQNWELKINVVLRYFGGIVWKPNW